LPACGEGLSKTHKSWKSTAQRSISSFCVFMNQEFLRLPGDNLKSGMTHVSTLSKPLRRDPAVALGGLYPQQAHEHLVGGVGELGVQLEAVALEILHRVGLAVGQAWLLELLGDGVAEDGQAAVLLPEPEERPSECVPHLREVGQVLGVGD